MAKKLLKTVLVILGIILLAAAALILWLSVTEFKPGDVMDVKVEANSEVSGLSPFLDEEFSVISWNIGYAGLGKGSDFFMDGGTNVSSADQDTVAASLLGIYKTLYSSSDPATIFMLQEVDKKLLQNLREGRGLRAWHKQQHLCAQLLVQIRPLPRAAYRPGKQRTSDDNGVRYRLSRAHIAALPV